jgi:tetratricopeptide (TPR) repeat protein
LRRGGRAAAFGTGAAARSAEKASLEKAIDIKRRAQRCFQNGDLDGALSEYEKLTRAEDSEPINLVVMADLLYKKEDLAEASRRYLQAVDAYTGAGLYKNAIAVCKKMARLSLSLAAVLQRLAELHSLDGLSTEAALYHQEYAEHQARESHFRGAADSLKKAFEASPDNPRLLEKAAERLLQADDATAAAVLLIEASRHFMRRGQSDDAMRAQTRAEELAPGANAANAAQAVAEAAAAETPGGSPAAEPALEAVTPLQGERVDGLEQRPAFEYPSAGNASPEMIPADVTPPVPAGLRFGSLPGISETPATSAISAMPEMSDIEDLLSLAAERFKQGEQVLAADALVEAARAYESLERLESAAAIYRSLGRSAHATPEVLGLWLRNCELREELREAAEVSCGLGDRALNDGDLEVAREWFGRALKHVPNHELAARRIQRMGPGSTEAAPVVNPAAPGTSKGPNGRVEVAIGRAQAVTFDLGSLIAEFQRGIESQISGDAQSHYDLGMTYREMGLIDQAVECFRAAAHDPVFGSRAAEMIGRCLLDEGRFDEAAEEFARALEGFEESSEAGVCLRFQLGLAHEVAGHAPEALAEFERVYAVQPNYPDVAQKIGILRRALERV